MSLDEIKKTIGNKEGAEYQDIPDIWKENFSEISDDIAKFWESMMYLSPSELDIEEYMEIFFDEKEYLGDINEVSDEDYLKIRKIMNASRKEIGFKLNNFNSVLGRPNPD